MSHCVAAIGVLVLSASGLLLAGFGEATPGFARNDGFSTGVGQTGARSASFLQPGQVRRIDNGAVVAKASKTPQIKPQATLVSFSEWGTAAAVSPTGDVAAIGSYRLVKLFDVKAKKEIASIPIPTGFVKSLAFSRDGSRLAVGSYQAITLIGMADKSVQKTLKGHRAYVMSLSFHLDGTTLASGSEDETVRLWNIETGEARMLADHTLPVMAVAYSPDGVWLATASGDTTRPLKGGELRLRTASDGETKRHIAAHERPIFGIAFSPNGSLIGTASQDESIRLWNTSDLKLHKTLSGHNRPVNALAFVTTGKFLASVGGGQSNGGNEGRLWDVEEGTEKASFVGHAAPVVALGVTPDGESLVTASHDRTARLYSLKEATQPKANPKPDAAKPDTKPAGTKPGEKPSTDKPSTGKPASEKPSGNKPAQPGETRPAPVERPITSASPATPSPATATSDTVRLVPLTPAAAAQAIALLQPAPGATPAQAKPADGKPTEGKPGASAGGATATATSQVTAVRTLRAGIIGLDTSHSVAFTKLLNDPNVKEDLAQCRVVAAYPKGSYDIESSTSRVPGYIDEVKKHGVEIVDSIDDLVLKVDVVFLESNDGRPHLEQALPVFRAGKPVFIDKPLAGSLTDAVALFNAARHYKVGMFSSSSLRYAEGAQAIRNGKIGDVLGCDAYSPCSLEKTHPDLFWYGIHGVETLFTVMGPGCEVVTRASTEVTDVAVGVWTGGRVGTFRGIRKGKASYGGTAFGSKGNEPIGPFGGYRPLLVEAVKFFRTGVVPVSEAETLDIYAFMEAADESKRQGGAPVRIATVMEKARAEAKKRFMPEP